MGLKQLTFGEMSNIKIPWNIVITVLWVVGAYLVNIKYTNLVDQKLFVIFLFIGPLLVTFKYDFLLFASWIPSFYLLDSNHFFSISIYTLLLPILRFYSIKHYKKDIVLIISNHFVLNFAESKVRFGIFDIASTILLFTCLSMYIIN